MKQLICLLAIAGLLSVCVHSYAQESGDSPLNDNSTVEPLQVVPASPEAATLGSYGNTQVNLYAGTANVSIPIHTVQGREIAYPISLSYSGAGGIKVEDVATWVGLGWSLSAEGVISKTMVGKPDFSESIYGSATGYRNIKDAYDDAVKFKNGWQSLDGFTSPEDEVSFAEDVMAGKIETQFDYYNFNFNGNSGKFLPVFNDNGSVGFIETPYQNMVISPALESDYSEDGNWEIITSDGTKYIFTFADTEKTKTIQENVEGSHYISAWYLSTIVSPNGLDVITFEYDTDMETDPLTGEQVETYHINPSLPGRSASDQIRVGATVSNCPCEQDPKQRNTGSDNGDYSSTGTKKYLKTIKLNGQVVVEFVHSTEPRLDLPGRRILESIVIKDYVNKQLSTTYEVKRFNFAYDYFKSDPHKTIEESSQNELRLKLLSVQEVGALPGSIEYASVINEKPAYRFEYNATNLPSRESYAQDFWGYYNGADGNNTLIPRTTFQNEIYDGAIRLGNAEYGQAALLEKIHYPTGGYTEFAYEGHDMKPSGAVNYKDNTLVYYVPGNKNVPGCPSDSGSYQQWFDKDAFVGVSCPAVSSLPFELEYDQPVTISTTISGDAPTERFQAKLLRIGTDSTPLGLTKVWETYNFDQTAQVSLNAGRYLLVFFNGVTSQAISAKVKHQIRVIDPDEIENNIGGVRLAKMVDYDNLSAGKTIIKRYEYSNRYSKGANDPLESSGIMLEKPSFTNISHWVYQPPRMVSAPGGQNNELMQSYMESYTVTYLNRHAGSIGGLNAVGGNHMGYSEVIEYNEDEQGNNLGAVVQHFKTYSTYTASAPAAPSGNKGDLNGALIKKEVYNKEGQLLSSVESNYEVDSKYYIQGLVVAQDYSWRYFFCELGNQWFEFEQNGHLIYMPVDGPDRDLFFSDENTIIDNTWETIVNFLMGGADEEEYYITSLPCTRESRPFNTKYTSRGYALQSYAQYLTSTTSRTYEPATGQMQELVQTYYYDNPAHYQPTRVRVADSEGDTLETLTRYAIDFDTLADPVITALQEANRLFMPVDRLVYKETGTERRLVGNVHTAFQQLGPKIYPYESYLLQAENGLAGSEFDTQSIPYTLAFPEQANHSLEQSLTYMLTGNVQSVKAKAGPVKQYVWGYDNRYPVFEVTHTDTYPYYYDGFESGQHASKVNNRDQAASGNYYISLGQPFQASIAELSTAHEGEYILQYFWKSQPGDDWVMQREEVTLAAGINVTAGTQKTSGYIDEVMLYKKGSAIASYAFYPGVGMQSAVAPDASRVRYDYDKLGRLSLLRDQNLEIIKRYEYLYAGQYAWQAYVQADKTVARSQEPIQFTVFSDEYVTDYTWTLYHGGNVIALSENAATVSFIPPTCGSVRVEVVLRNEDGLPLKLETFLPGEEMAVTPVISGTTQVSTGEEASFFASASGGCGQTYVYKWYKQYSTGSGRIPIGYGPSLHYTFGCNDANLILEARDLENNVGTTILPLSIDDTMTVGIGGPSEFVKGTLHTYTASVTGGCRPYKYQWFQKYGLEQAVQVGTDEELHLSGDICRGSFTLTLYVTDMAGNRVAYSKYVSSEAFTFTVQPYNNMYCWGEYVYIEAYASGGCDISNRQYQWYSKVGEDWEPIPGAVANSLYAKRVTNLRLVVTEDDLSGFLDVAITYKTDGCSPSGNDDPCPDNGSGIPCYDNGEAGIE